MRFACFGSVWIKTGQQYLKKTHSVNFASHRFSIFLSPKWSSQKHATVYAILARGRQRKQHGSFLRKSHNGASFTVATANKQWPPIRVSLSQSAYQLLASALRQRESKADRNGSEGVGRGGLTWSGILFLHLKSSQISELNVTETRGLLKGRMESS